MSYGRQLAKKITTWVDEGLISPYQAESIRAFESKHYRVGRKAVRRIAWQLLAFFLLVLGGLTLVAANWASWGLPFRLGILFAGVGGCQWVAWRLIQEKIPAWLQARLNTWGVSSSMYGDIAAVILCVTAPIGMLLLSQQYPFSPPLWVSLSWLVWVLVPLMLWLRRDVGLLLVGLMALIGAIIAPSEKALFLIFPYWAMGMFRLGASSQRGALIESALYLVWMGCLATVLWPLVHVFWYWPILGLMFYFARVLGAGNSRTLLQLCGLGMALGWAVLAMWWTPPVSVFSMGIVTGMVLLGLWQHRVSFPDGPKPVLARLKLLLAQVVGHPFLLVFVFLFWTLCLAVLQHFLPQFHAFWEFLHAVFALGLAVFLSWTTNRMLRSLGFGLLVVVVGILLVQPIFPAWMRGILMVSGGFGLWVFLRIRREGGLSPLSPAQGDRLADSVFLLPQKWRSKWAMLTSPSAAFFKRGVMLLFVLQLLLLSKPVWLYEWVRLSGDSYVMQANFQDVYTPFRGPYLQLKMTDFETAWPLVLPAGTRHAYLQMTAKSGVLKPLSLHAKAPEGLYLRIPVKWKSSVETVTHAPFERLFFPESKQASFKKSVGRGSVIWLHVKVRHGYAVLERITVGEKK